MAERWIIRVDKKGRRRPERIVIPDKRTAQNGDQRTEPPDPPPPDPHRDDPTGKGVAIWA